MWIEEIVIQSCLELKINLLWKAPPSLTLVIQEFEWFLADRGCVLHFPGVLPGQFVNTFLFPRVSRDKVFDDWLDISVVKWVVIVAQVLLRDFPDPISLLIEHYVLRRVPPFVLNFFQELLQVLHVIVSFPHKKSWVICLFNLVGSKRFLQVEIDLDRELDDRWLRQLGLLFSGYNNPLAFLPIVDYCSRGIDVDILYWVAGARVLLPLDLLENWFE